ncbi:hypothetical protein SeMB42_g01238 [Synchytrium endobioticum]|uniref:Uncharacterized protein n=1 Tax=Synchytrium endobioticum TaxID=286115 RepID=A0A507DGQ1_9FUNG|nr:hypothetical protein SeLEV6574_g00702 [Synchytrium endobioticum]TPX52691.1 hypothetical protein SeMB42_g01238 [Synchytrium endobioticum]
MSALAKTTAYLATVAATLTGAAISMHSKDRPFLVYYPPEKRDGSQTSTISPDHRIIQPPTPTPMPETPAPSVRSSISSEVSLPEGVREEDRRGNGTPSAEPRRAPKRRPPPSLLSLSFVPDSIPRSESSLARTMPGSRPRGKQRDCVVNALVKDDPCNVVCR